MWNLRLIYLVKSSPPEVFVRKGPLKICSTFTGEHPCRSVISVQLFCSFIGITFQHGCSPVKLLHIFKTPFPNNTSGGLLFANTHSTMGTLRTSMIVTRVRLSLEGTDFCIYIKFIIVGFFFSFKYWLIFQLFIIKTELQFLC